MSRGVVAILGIASTLALALVARYGDVEAGAVWLVVPPLKPRRESGRRSTTRGVGIGMVAATSRT